MTHPSFVRLLAVFALAAAGLPLFAAEPAPLQRYGIIIGVNEGGPTRATLKFAAADAEAFAAVMQEMGGLAAGQRILLVNPDQRGIAASFAAMQKRLFEEKELFRRQEFILYYSGHSDEEGLLIGGDRLTYRELRGLVAAVPADVRIAVIDSCSSGVFIRTKGGVPKPPFLVDVSADMKGYAFLTSSSETEAAQESDRIEGSFFTHSLVSGLRGAADASQDGVVTLNEAYHFAFSETLVRTERTQFGPQHPSYDIQLSGTGDLVLTDLRGTSAALVITEEVEGRIFIRNSRGKLVVELNKQEQVRHEIGLAPGSYSVVVDRDGGLRHADVKLAFGRRVTLASSDLKALRPERTVRRGTDGEEEAADGGPAAEAAVSETDASGESPRRSLTVKPFLITFFPGTDEGGETVAHALVFNLTVGTAYQVNGAGFSLIGGIVDHDLTGFQGAFVFNISGGGVRYCQSAGVFNIAGGEVTGLQSGGVFNIAGAGVRGVQMAGVFNTSGGALVGLQLAALNIAEDVTGGQVGMVNIARKVSGVQIGLVNIAEENDGLALGLLSFSAKGIHNFELWHDSTGMSQLAFKFGTKHFYTIAAAGHIFPGGSGTWYYGLGWGAHLPLGRCFLDIDALLTSRSDASEGLSDNRWVRSLLPRVRAKAGWQFSDGIGAFAGVDFQIYHPYCFFDSEVAADALFHIPVPGMADGCAVVPRFFAGVQIF